MKIGNILAAIGGIIGILGLISLPIWNLRELPYLADPAYPKGSGWILLVQTGIFARPGIILFIFGAILFAIGMLLPKKYWKTQDDLLEDEIKKGFKKKKSNKEKNT
jgi:hypothetical protein